MPNFMAAPLLSSRGRRPRDLSCCLKFPRYARDDNLVVASRRLAELGDALDHRRNLSLREVVTPAWIGLDLRPRHEARDVAAARDGQQRIVLAVQHQRRHLDLLQHLDPIARGDDREILPGAALGIPAAVDVPFDERAQLRLDGWIAGAGDGLAKLDAVL